MSAKNTEIKKKKGLSATAVIIIVIAAVCAIAIAAFIFIKLQPAKDRMTMDDYSRLELPSSLLDISDATAESLISGFISAFTTTDYVTDGTVEYGDVIYAGYVGTCEGEEVEYSEGAEVQVGYFDIVDGFDEALVGASVGEGISFTITYPDDFPAKSLQGKDVDFQVSIAYKLVTDVPELTDTFVKENSEAYFGSVCEKADDLQEFARDYQRRFNIESALFEELKERQHVISRDQARFDELYDYAQRILLYYAMTYNTDVDSYAQANGYESADDYSTQEAEYYSDEVMLMNYMCDRFGLTFTDEDVERALKKYMLVNGFSETYGMEDFIDAQGETWFMLFKAKDVRFDALMSALEPNIVYIDLATGEEVSVS